MKPLMAESIELGRGIRRRMLNKRKAQKMKPAHGYGSARCAMCQVANKVRGVKGSNSRDVKGE